MMHCYREEVEREVKTGKPKRKVLTTKVGL